MSLAASDRLKLADEALHLCRQTGQIQSYTKRTDCQATAIYMLINIDRLDMSIFRIALGLDKGTFDKGMHLARQIIRNNRVPKISQPCTLEQAIIAQFEADQVAK
jgi:hypothetical protein